MIHRYINDLLKDSIAAILANPVILDDLFQENYELVSDESDAIKQYFADKGLNVINGYPRQNTDFPSVCIILGDEAENEHIMGDDAGFIDDETDPNYGMELNSSFWDHAYRLLIITEHPDVTAYYYEIVKYIMADGQDSLGNDGCFAFHMSGNDLAPDGRYLPEHLFARQLIFKCRREFQLIVRDGPIRTGLSTEGIHVDSSGSPSDVGSVKTNVTPYVESE